MNEVPLNPWIKTGIIVLFGAVVTQAGYIWTSKDSEDESLRGSVKDLTTQVSSLAVSTTKLNAIMTGIVIPNTNDLKQSVKEVRAELNKRAATILQAEITAADLHQLKEELRDATKERYTNIQAREDHANTAMRLEDISLRLRRVESLNP